MKATFIITLLLISQCLQAQKIGAVDDSKKYIQDYYSGFTTGYDYDGNYVTLSDNYKVSFSDAIFTLTFDTYNKNNIQKQTITINLKDVISLEPSGSDSVEIYGNDPYIVPICGKLAFATNKEVYEINSYYEVDADVEQSQIFKAFAGLINTL